MQGKCIFNINLHKYLSYSILIIIKTTLSGQNFQRLSLSKWIDLFPKICSIIFQFDFPHWHLYIYILLINRRQPIFIYKFSNLGERQIEMHNFMTNLLKNDWTLSTTTLCMHPLYMCIRTRLSACLSVFLWACVRAQEVGIALGHAGIFGPKGLVGERGKSAILTKRMPGKLNIMGDLPYLFCSSAARQNSWKDNKERKAGKPAKSCTAYGKVTRFPLLLFGLQLQTSVCVCVWVSSTMKRTYDRFGGTELSLWARTRSVKTWPK